MKIQIGEITEQEYFDLVWGLRQEMYTVAQLINEARDYGLDASGLVATRNRMYELSEKMNKSYNLAIMGVKK